MSEQNKQGPPKEEPPTGTAPTPSDVGPVSGLPAGGTSAPDKPDYFADEDEAERGGSDAPRSSSRTNEPEEEGTS